MINHMIPLLHSFLNAAFLRFWFYPMIALAFLITVPCIIRQIFLGGK